MSNPRVSLLSYLPLLLALGYVCAVSVTGADLEGRIRGMRYWTLLAMAVYAIAAPHVLLPDRHLRLMQRVNKPPIGLLRHQLAQWQPVIWVFVLPAFVLAFWDPGSFSQHVAAKAEMLFSTASILFGVATYSFVRYVRIGPLSQSWQEGSKGDWYRTIKENSPGGFAVPEGMVPAMLATQRVYGMGLITLVTSAYLGQSIHPLLAFAPGLSLLVWTIFLLKSGADQHDRAYYATNAFYSEIFRSTGGVRTSIRESLPFKAVYWSPARFKPHLWASLSQFDRVLPLGRLMAAAHALLWVLFYIDASTTTVAAYLLLLISAKNAASHVLTRPALTPLPFHLSRQSPAGWIMTRFLVNLRWTFPLLMSLLLVAAFDPTLSYPEALGWTVLDTVMGLATATLFTLQSEYRYRRHLA